MTTVKSPFVDKVDQRFIVPRCCLDMTDIPIGTGIQCAWILYKHVLMFDMFSWIVWRNVQSYCAKE